VLLAAIGLGVLASVGAIVFLGYRVASEIANRPAPPAPATAPVAGLQPAPASRESPDEDPPRPTLALALQVKPSFGPADAQRTPQSAYDDMREALQQGDGRRAAKYLPNQKLASLGSEREVLSELDALTVDSARVVQAHKRGEKAVLFVKAVSAQMTSADGSPADIDAILRLAREDGHWKLARQLWLVNSAVEQEQQEALGWLKAP
jgi:hypothetical protein